MVASTLSDVQLLLGFSESIESIARLESDTTADLVNLSNGIAADTTASLTSLTNSTNSIDSDSGGGSGDSGGGGYARPVGDLQADDVLLQVSSHSRMGSSSPLNAASRRVRFRGKRC